MSNNTLSVIRSAASALMDGATPVKLPVGEVIALNSMAQLQKVENIDAHIGIWECEPGKLRRHMPQREFSHIISGWCIFTPEGGEPVELHAGDSVTFPANCQGVWEIKEKLRKVFCLF